MTRPNHAIAAECKRTLSLVGAFAFANRNGKRLFMAGYNDNGFEPLEKIMKSLTFK